MTKPPRMLAIGPAHQIAMARPVSWAVDAGWDVWLLAKSRPEGIEKGTYSYIPSLSAKIGMYDTRILKGRFLRNFYLVWAALECRILAWIIRPNLVHAHHLSLAAAACGLAKLSPLVVSVWGGGEAVGSKPGVFLGSKRSWRSLALRNADMIIAEHPRLKDTIDAVITHPARAQFLTLGIDTNRFAPKPPEVGAELRRTLGIDKSTIVLLSARGFSSHYRHLEIVEAFARAKPKFERTAVLVLMKLPRKESQEYVSGYAEHIQQRAKSLQIESSIRWLERQPHSKMPEVYTMADCVINYPLTDVFPSTLLEAAASECLILSNRLDIYTDTYLESCACFISHEDVDAFAMDLVSIVNSNRERYSMQLRAGRNFVNKHYAEDREKKRLLSIYAQLCNLGNSPFE